MNLKLYDSPKNPNSRKIHAIAHELGLTLSLVPVDLAAGEGKKPEFLKLNPNGKIPALVDGDHTVWESNAIMIYLANQYGQTTLLPQDPKDRSKMDQWMFWQTAHLQPAMGKIAMETIYKKRFSLGDPDPAMLELGFQELDRFAGVLNGVLADQSYVTGQNITLADFAVAGSFGYRKDAGVDLSKWEYLSRWLTSIEDRPSWRKTLQA